ncbi:zinc ribbon domain-containing protein [Jutongia sp.]|uniref:zinc ribbon domain-containing protein n=1 Tax=Jutongia sp. TaxID=2944204 RepID=UPI003080CCBC
MMALIKCSECGKEVSDRATTCPHCGCPMVAENHCVINGLDVDCSFIFNNEYDQEIKELIMMEKTNLDLQIIEKIVYEWSAQGKIPPVFNGKVSTWEEDNKKILSQQSNTPKCPTCGSTNIQKISGTKRWLSAGLFGLASSDVGKSMVCKSCGYKW